MKVELVNVVAGLRDGANCCQLSYNMVKKGKPIRGMTHRKNLVVKRS